MNEHRPGEGGAANTPPFPRIDYGLSADDPRLPDEDLPAPTPRLQDDTPPIEFASAGDGEEYDDEFHDDFDDFTDDPDDDVDDDDLDWRAMADDYSPMDDDDAEPFLDDEPAPGFASRARDDMKRHAAESSTRGFEHFADRLDEVAERIDRIASDRLHGTGRGQRAADAAHSTAGWIAGVSDYMRGTDLEELRSDLEDQVRRSPLRSVLIAVGAGWLLGKIIR